MQSEIHDSYEFIPGNPGCAVFLTCEHASDRFPRPHELPPDDHWIQGTHWTFDLGAAELTRELAARLGAGAVLSRFSRLLADPNRPEDSPDLFRRIAEGRELALNRQIAPADREARLGHYRAYHAAVDRAVRATSAPLMLAIHSFTPLYEGTPRTVEAGILFDREAKLGEELAQQFAEGGFETRLNEPYSGAGGFMYSVDHHAAEHGRAALELELRQDLAVDPSARSRTVDVIARFAELIASR